MVTAKATRPLDHPIVAGMLIMQSPTGHSRVKRRDTSLWDTAARILGVAILALVYVQLYALVSTCFMSILGACS